MIGQVIRWKHPPRRLDLSRNDVHVWKIDLESAPAWVDRFFELLSAEERNRAERFHFNRDRRRFIVRHGVLRLILSRYLDHDSAQLQFAYGSRGKPYLEGIFKDSGIRFNMSDSQDQALIALTRGREIGIDLEHIRPVPDIERMVERNFSPLETGVFLSLPPDQRLEAFFSGWTRKEAFVKALGEGLAYPLAEFDVTLAPGEPARLIKIRDDPQEVSRWSLQALVPAQEMVAALAVEGDDWRLECWRWSESQTLPRSVKRKFSNRGRFTFERENSNSEMGEVDINPNFTRASPPSRNKS